MSTPTNSASITIAVTGATGQLGRIVIDRLLAIRPAASIIAVVRNPDKAAPLAARGIQVREAAYDDAPALDRALAGAGRVLLIASNEIGRRTAQHRNVIAAAGRRKVERLVFTSLLHADISPLSLAGEYRETEAALKESGMPHVILRNGWYAENHTALAPAALANGVLHGSAGDGRISSASRADFAEAAVKVLTGDVPVSSGQIFELAGDEAHTLAGLAAEISRQTGKNIPYKNLPEADYRAMLVNAGLPEALAAGFASWDADASRGALFDDGRQLSRLIGRATTPLSESVAQALKSVSAT
ncbi:SDR family oxidoreductase [Termitidicoccus mucosus]|uniref:NAD(P)-dependent oxidoreductase n=1 Tax=Termitidicoccus mucosus TaxID=1184151 RepID=A0A178IAU6_9BACT|nr:NAD(P)-dependent oxidoreductase [Opitutaceae bacterium TSB47]